jgi:hypothetical protein
MAKRKQPFISKQDRPSVEIDLDKPITQLRIRDLRDILGGRGRKVPHPKFELGKTEIKEFFDKDFPEKTPEIGFRPGPETAPAIGTGLERLINVTAGLAERVDDLAKQVAALEKKKSG